MTATIGSAAVTAVPASADAGAITTVQIEPSSTGAGITTETNVDRYHVVVEPDGDRQPELVVMLSGSNVAAAGYGDLVAHAGGLGYAAVSLSYPNQGTIGAACQTTVATDRCFDNARGEIVFGAGVPDPQGQTYASGNVSVDAANSISGRLVALIDHLAVQDPWWGSFLVDDVTSPYVATHRGPVRLDHRKLILAGHSQGGGHAAFLAMRTEVERAILLGSPDDTTQSGTATWIGAASATPLDHYWAMRHQSEGAYGAHLAQVWSELGGAGIGAGDNTAEVQVGDGSGDPQGSHRLVLTVEQGTALKNHMSTAYDGSYLAGVPVAWTYLLTADGDATARAGQMARQHAQRHAHGRGGSHPPH
ncbi:hypothetical protein [Nocardioides sp. YR527]|uniref:BPSS1187 family protein n=1 Tax=Nocardioides sp. YR527 TaxID=1881028 RepID=UPI00115FA420|nr:hypothetical protein [Nocardioides sp. YR527]